MLQAHQAGLTVSQNKSGIFLDIRVQTLKKHDSEVKTIASRRLCD